MLIGPAEAVRPTARHARTPLEASEMDGEWQRTDACFTDQTRMLAAGGAAESPLSETRSAASPQAWDTWTLVRCLSLPPCYRRARILLDVLTAVDNTRQTDPTRCPAAECRDADCTGHPGFSPPADAEIAD